jgi:hypothetical protein
VILQNQKEEYKKMVVNDPHYFRQLAAVPPDYTDSPNCFDFKNSGGIFEKGVCWWHSRFQRSAFYLTLYLPNEPRQTREKIKSMIWDIMMARRVVEIAGFNNFKEFSKEYKNEIKDCLDSIQLIEGVFAGAWINGMAGNSNVSPKEMKEKMDDIYREVTKNGLAYVKLQSPGIFCSHAWLITEIEELKPNKIGEIGYQYSFIDSNYPHRPLGWFYYPGDTHIHLFQDLGVPYLQRRYELRKIKRAIKKYIEM